MVDKGRADWITIASDRLTAAINPHGAELSSILDADGRELMTDADPAFWTGRAPILFPVIGVTNGSVIRLDGHDYPMAKHGFARHSDFAVVEHAAGRLLLRLEDSEATRASYPFAFALDLAFTVEGATITLAASIANRGDAAMPAQFGFHPALAWPLPYGEPRADHRIAFDADEPARLAEIAPDGLIAAETRASPLDGRTLHLADALFENDALVWDPIVSQGVTYGASVGPTLRVEFPDTPRLGVWTKPGAHYVCIEPWHGIADPEGFTGEFRAKPGVFEVAAGQTKRIAMSIALQS
ncbi:aldose 1-epimerase family protein [Sphingomonas bacterium]|uniref:aldose 1-epimerase family protein n=1 Tax=Sphingomonas bacterium TaxID=1895847 RepID=UPI001575F49A|nr:aldose 1-epimerase family protein [Sphingomonas bacterium]